MREKNEAEYDYWVLKNHFDYVMKLMDFARTESYLAGKD
jgi:hypothetical protein